jgi:hypothetical protein
MAFPGEPFIPDKTIEEILGTEACQAAGLTDAEKGRRWRDIAFSNQAQFAPNDGKKAETIQGGEWDHIIKAIEHHTKFTYKGRGPNSCCTTL